MHANELMLSKVRRRYAKFSRTLQRGYRFSYPRNKVLQLRSRERTDRFFSAGNKRFVVFLMPGWDDVNGGIMSVCSIAAETRKLLSMHGVSVAVCTAYAYPRLLRYTKFKNEEEVLSFADLLPRFPEGSEVLVHMSELNAQRFGSDQREVYRSRPDIRWRFNILLQRDLMPKKETVDTIKKIGPTTVTLAYQIMGNEATQLLDCPAHFLSWFISPDDFERRGYATKRKLIIISPDHHPAKAEIVARMSDALPDHKIVEIRNMTYETYKSVIKDAKFAFTFGEGLDGYFAEPIFCGGVGMALFEERYFTPEYRGLVGLFPDGQAAISGVADFLKTTDNADRYDAVAAAQYNLVARTFDRNEYVGNIRTFYETYFPEWYRPASTN